MRITHPLVVVLFSLGIASADDPVHIPDPNLKAAIERELWTSDPAPIDMLGLTRLYADDRGIADLTGLEYATNLTELELTRNRIHDISVVSGLTNLRSLILNNNYISDISVVSGLTNLEVLDVHNNELTDISPISGLTNLHTLFLRINQISDISPISGLTKIETLELRNNEISDISPLAGLTELRSVTLSSNQISDISVVSGFTDLENITLDRNQISDISVFAAFTSLRCLTLSDNPLNQEAYDLYIPQIKANNPGLHLSYDPPVWYSVVISATAGGTVTWPGEGEFMYGKDETLTLQAVAGQGFRFVSWSGSYSSGENPAYATITHESQILANFVSILDTLYVDDDGPNDPGPDNSTVSDPQENGTAEHPFDRIQEAIEVAANGATIFVHEGTYRESIDFLGKSLEVRGSNPEDANDVAWAVIEPVAGKPAVTFSEGEDPTDLLIGFVLTGGEGQLTGGIRCAGSHATVANCLIVGNRATDPTGAAVFCTDSDVALINCTIADNYAWVEGAGLYLRNSHATVVNSILWANTPREIIHFGTGGVSASYSTIAGGWPGVGNLKADPLFAGRGYWASANDLDVAAGPEDPGAVWVAGDYHLQSQLGRWDPKAGEWVKDKVTSPCVDSGDPADPIGPEPVPNGGIINMGAYGGTDQAGKSPGTILSP